MAWQFITITCLLGIISGIREGMIFIQASDHNMSYTNTFDGVRGHEDFRFYHAIRLLEMIAVFAFVIKVPAKITAPNLLLTTGSLFLLWEFFEIGYAVSRWNKFMSHEENIDFDIISWRLKPYVTLALHVIRILAGISLLTGSMIWTG